jgi:hypothetical protein
MIMCHHRYDCVCVFVCALFMVCRDQPKPSAPASRRAETLSPRWQRRPPQMAPPPIPTATLTAAQTSNPARTPAFVPATVSNESLLPRAQRPLLAAAGAPASPPAQRRAPAPSDEAAASQARRTPAQSDDALSPRVAPRTNADKSRVGAAACVPCGSLQVSNVVCDDCDVDACA